MTYEQWLDAKIEQIERELEKLDKEPVYYSMYDVIEGMLKITKTCRNQYRELDKCRK